LYVYRGLVFFRGGPVLLGCGVFPYHVAPFGLPIWWGHARSSVWLRDDALVRSLHVVGEGTPDFGYRKWPWSCLGGGCEPVGGERELGLHLFPK
jgi:hypothetical protein